jgi:AraC family transcriptional activator FtrA
MRVDVPPPLLAQRVRLAQRLLEITDLTTDAVAARSGFRTAGNLRRHFAEAVHTSPAAYRRSFSAGQGRSSDLTAASSGDNSPPAASSLPRTKL